MIESHLNRLIQIGDLTQGFIGVNSVRWANMITSNYNFYQGPNKQFDRYGLLNYCQDNNNRDLDVLVAILSWGGMRTAHGRILFKNLVTVLNLIKALRAGQFQTRQSAFLAFRSKRAEGLLSGLGIAYFTKLICFSAPSLNGYIMDQWSSKSINLLTGQQVIHISNNWVSDKNDENVYELFCAQIDNLASLLNCSGFEAEKRIFSVGRGKGEWRKHLICHYKN
jgi:hypothetical protein